jgi:hypothetical protein
MRIRALRSNWSDREFRQNKKTPADCVHQDQPMRSTADEASLEDEVLLCEAPYGQVIQLTDILADRLAVALPLVRLRSSHA